MKIIIIIVVFTKIQDGTWHDATTTTRYTGVLICLGKNQVYIISVSTHTVCRCLSMISTGNDWSSDWRTRMSLTRRWYCWKVANRLISSATPLTFVTLLSDRFVQLVAWHSGNNVGLGRRTFSVARSTFSWWVTTYVGKLSIGGQPTRSTQPVILSRLINEWWAAMVDICHLIWWGRHLVNAYEVKAGMVFFAF